MKFSYLYIIFFFLTNHLEADDLKIYNIGFLDIKEDMRYLIETFSWKNIMSD